MWPMRRRSSMGQSLFLIIDDANNKVYLDAKYATKKDIKKAKKYQEKGYELVLETIDVVRTKGTPINMGIHGL